MKVIGYKTTIKAKKLNPKAFKFNSLVDEPGNETAWEKVKKLDLVKVKETKEMTVKNKEKGKSKVVPVSIECEKSIYTDLDKVEAFLKADGYEGFTIEEKDKSFIVTSTTDKSLFSGEASQIEIAPGAIATVDTLLQEKAKSEEVEVVDGDVTDEPVDETIVTDGEVVEAEPEVTEEPLVPEVPE
jgi:hypothetical protein